MCVLVHTGMPRSGKSVACLSLLFFSSHAWKRRSGKERLERDPFSFGVTDNLSACRTLFSTPLAERQGGIEGLLATHVVPRIPRRGRINAYIQAIQGTNDCKIRKLFSWKSLQNTRSDQLRGKSKSPRGLNEFSGSFSHD